jgi:nucleoside-diphosphate-sugar epimerase
VEFALRQHAVLVTGASGEIGHGLIERLSNRADTRVVTIDLRPPDGDLTRRIERSFVGSILDSSLLENVLAEYHITEIYHLAALLSTRSEFTPVTAHQVNVEGTLHLLEFAQAQGRSHGERVLFFYPSSIAVYGLPGAEAKRKAGAVKEDEWNTPITMYGCNKLACEHLGRYYARHYKQLDAHDQAGRVDFRSLRFPGLISAVTVPSGGTSDFAPEMIHAAARGDAYDCFVRPDARIPFMAMPDAVEAIFGLMRADADRLARQVYNLAAFQPSASEIEASVRKHFPKAVVRTKVDAKRMAIVDSWPAEVDDRLARRDFGYAPKYDWEHALTEYLVPGIKSHYGGA